MNRSNPPDLELGQRDAPAVTARRHNRSVSMVFWMALCTFVSFSIAGIFVSNPLMLWLIVISGWIISLALHEYCHALVAYWGGDFSIRDKGYLTLNFLLYLDPLMTLAFPVLLLVLGGIALPGGSVLVDMENIRTARWEVLVSLAGPIGNLLFGALIRLKLACVDWMSLWATNDYWVYHGCTGKAITVLIFLQGMAALLNLLPLPPLDGWGAMSPCLPATNPFKQWIRESPWNARTASLVTFGLIYVVGATTPMWRWMTVPIRWIFLLDGDLLTQGFGLFFSMWS